LPDPNPFRIAAVAAAAFAGDTPGFHTPGFAGWKIVEQPEQSRLAVAFDLTTS
jgi:hypothetical protein